MCVNSLSTEATRFFRALGFIQDDISECRLRPLLSRKMVSPVETSLSTLLFYYPSYRVNSVSMFSNDSLWFDVSLKSISDEIDFWRERSVESYHDQITLVLRLKSEIVKLHNQLRQRDKQLKEIKQENKELRHIVTQSNAMAAISTIDELGSLFESIKDLCSVVR
uniref:Uncharacterized protein n=2 Tax=Tetranychus urticae TaxID=32264 RepID=T1JRH5_TETUR